MESKEKEQINAKTDKIKIHSLTDKDYENTQRF